MGQRATAPSSRRNDHVVRVEAGPAGSAPQARVGMGCNVPGRESVAAKVSPLLFETETGGTSGSKQWAAVRNVAPKIASA